MRSHRLRRIVARCTIAASLAFTACNAVTQDEMQEPALEQARDPLPARSQEAALVDSPAGKQEQSLDRVRTELHNFVASSRGTVYYWLGCDAWKSLSAANLRYFRSAEEALQAGYTPSRSRGCAGPPAGERIQPSINGNAACIVRNIVDGDTFDCMTGDRVRLLLIDAPELAQVPYGDSARLVLSSLLPTGTSARLEFDVQLRDQYDRLLAHVYSNGRHVNRDLVRSGVAVTLVLPPNVRHVEAIRLAVDSARVERLGFWAIDAFRCLPEDFRAGRCR